MAKRNFPTREAYLEQFVADISREVFRLRWGQDCPRVKVSVGFPTSGREVAMKTKRGSCWLGNGTVGASDGVPQIFVSPIEDDPVKIGEVLAHEMLHAALPIGTGHRGQFRERCKQIGLEGNPSQTVAGEWLRGMLTGIVANYGAFPHAKIVIPEVRKRENRNFAADCTQSGCTYRLPDQKGNPKPFHIASISRQMAEGPKGMPKCPGCDHPLTFRGRTATITPIPVPEKATEDAAKGEALPTAA